MSFDTRILAHRGVSAAHPDNSLPAFAAAVDAGADGVELDVRRTADGQLALSHDPRLPDGRVIVELGADELPAGVARLDQALDVLRPLGLINIEIKNHPGDPDFDETEQVADAVVALLDERGELGDHRNLVSCFHRPTVDHVRRVAPELDTGWLLSGGEDMAARIRRTAALGHRSVHPHQRYVDEELVAHAHEAGLQVVTWTCDDPDRLRWLAATGVDAIIANDPAAAMRALGR